MKLNLPLGLLQMMLGVGTGLAVGSVEMISFELFDGLDVSCQCHFWGKQVLDFLGWDGAVAILEN